MSIQELKDRKDRLHADIEALLNEFKKDTKDDYHGSVKIETTWAFHPTVHEYIDHLSVKLFL